METQELIALALVGLAALALLYRLAGAAVSGFVADLLLRRGKVRAAMWFKARSRASGCDACAGCGPSSAAKPTSPDPTRR